MKHNFLSMFLPPLNLPQRHGAAGTEGQKDRGTEGQRDRGIKRWERIFTPSLRLSFSLSLLLSVALWLCGSVARVIAQVDQPKQAAKQGKSGRPKSAAVEIRAVLDAQVAAWNAGKLEEVTVGCWRAPDLTLFSGGRKMSGWDATIERYRKTYQAEGREMGKLAFSDLDIQQLGPNAAVVRGRWELTMSDGKRPGGLYNLIFRRFKQGWKSIHDHTSSN